MTATNHRRGKILFVCEDLNFGGGERLVSAICRRCREAGWEVGLIAEPRRSSVANSFDAWFSRAVDHVAWLPVADHAARMKLLAAPDVDAVAYFYPWRPALLAPFVAGLRRDIRQTVFVFNASAEGLQVLSQIAPALDLVIAESLDVLQSFEAVGLLRQPARLIPSRVEPIPMRAPHVSGNKLQVGYIGRLSREKNPMAVLAIANRLPRAGYSFRVIGDGGMRPKVALATKLLGWRRDVRFAGHLSDAELGRAFDQLDVIVVPSRIDGRPLVIQEAQWRGVVVVASRVGGIPELVTHEETGLLCEPGDIDDFARQLARLAADPALRNDLAGRARRQSEMEEDVTSRLARFAAAVTGSDARQPAPDGIDDAPPDR